MKIRLIAAGTRMPAWIDAGFDDYARRMPRECRLELVEIPLARQRRSGDVERAVSDEGARMLAAATGLLVALDVRGKSLDSPQLARRLGEWMQGGQDVNLLVGGPDGLAQDCLDRAQMRWSLSPLTLPHALVRVVVAEQLYRALSILRGHPYHRE